MAPASLPILSIDATDRYVDVITFGAFENIYELTGDLHAMFGWREQVEAVAEAYETLTPEEREKTILLARSYGNAGAIDYFGKAHGLPGAVSLHQTYHLWGLPEGPIETVLTVGFSSETMETVFEEVEEVLRIELENENPSSRQFVILKCRNPKRPLPEVWAANRPW